MEDEGPNRLKARIAGLCYLGVVLGGIFAEGVVRSRIVVPGDAAATMHAIAVHEQLWRAGLAVHLLYLLLTVPMSVILYALLKPAGATLARVALISSIMCSTVEAASLVQTTVPLALLHNPGLARLASEQAQAMAYLAVRLFETGFGFGTLLFSSFCLCTGLLILRSRLVARPIGVALAIGGVGYALNTVAGILAPQASGALFPWILLPGLVGETALALWLIVRGARPMAAEAASA